MIRYTHITYTHSNTHTFTQGKVCVSKRKRHTGRQTDRERDRQADRQAGRVCFIHLLSALDQAWLGASILLLPHYLQYRYC